MTLEPRFIWGTVTLGHCHLPQVTVLGQPWKLLAELFPILGTGWGVLRLPLGVVPAPDQVPWSSLSSLLPLVIMLITVVISFPPGTITMTIIRGPHG